MTIFWVVIAVAAFVVAYNIGYRREPIVRDVPELVGKPMLQLTWQSLFLISNGMRDQLPRRWMTVRPFPLMDHVRYLQLYVIHDLRENVEDLSSNVIMSLDPNGKFEEAAGKLLAKLRAANVVAFVKPDLPPGLDFAAVVTDPQTNVSILCVRDYDIRMNEFVTVLRATVACKVDISAGPRRHIIDDDKR